MSQIKRHLEELSEKLGYGGEINEAVMKAAIDDMAARLDIVCDSIRDSGNVNDNNGSDKQKGK